MRRAAVSRGSTRFLIGTALIATGAGGLALAAPESLLAGYEAAGAGPFSAAAGERAWTAEHRPAGADSPRSCATCHGTDLRKPGRHATTGNVIEPLAVSANPQRLAEPQKTERWFGRNCRWTLGRECTPQEKGDFVRLIQSR
jgi:Domain of unknown function (DUF1924)